MKTFNSIQIVILLMILPTLLELCYNATFTGARTLFWVGIVGELILAIATIAFVRIGIEKVD